MRPENELEEMTRIEMADKAERRRPPIEDLGWGNGWGTVPKIVDECPHVPVDVVIGPCVHQVTCAECGYTYKYDSGDCGT